MTLSDLLMSLFKKEWPWAICSHKMSKSLEKFVFFICFWQFSPFYAQERIAPATLYKRAAMSNLLRLLMTKDWLWAIRSGHSWQKSDRSNSLFFMSELLFRSLKTSKLLEIRWANSQPWLQSSTIINTYYLTLFILNGIVLVYLAPHWSSTLLG